MKNILDDLLLLSTLWIIIKDKKYFFIHIIDINSSKIKTLNDE